MSLESLLTKAPLILNGSTEESDTEVDFSIEEEVEFPNRCYACEEHVEEVSTPSSKEKGRFVVHIKSTEISGSGTTYHTPSIGLCAECTEKIAIIIDNWKEFKPVFNQVEEMND